jgi:hypothetical protein
MHFLRRKQGVIVVWILVALLPPGGEGVQE